MMKKSKSNRILEMKAGEIDFFPDLGRSTIVLASKIGLELSRKYLCRRDGVGTHIVRVK